MSVMIFTSRTSLLTTSNIIKIFGVKVFGAIFCNKTAKL